MRLSELKNGNKAIISKIHGTGAFRQRIIEMGFMEGKEIEAIKRAPLMDPVEYNIMGYSVSLRKSEAEYIEILSEDVSLLLSSTQAEGVTSDNYYSAGKDLTNIRVALVGNPNCGKTTLFNFASNSHERVANYTGVTVSSKEATAVVDKQKITIVDLPGTYSLSSYSPEELYVIDYLTTQRPDVVVNVVDGSNLERNLYLTTQLIDMGMPVIIALNMYDEMELNGDKLDHKNLSDLLGIPVIPTVGKKGKGVKDLFKKIVRIHKGLEALNNRISLRYTPEIETVVDDLILHLGKIECQRLFPGLSLRFVALKMLENDRFILEKIEKLTNSGDVIERSKAKSKEIEKHFDKEPSHLLTDARYGFVAGALKETFVPGTRKSQKISQKTDKIVTHRLIGLPIFFGLIWFMFYATFKIGEYPVGWIESLLAFISSGIGSILPEGLVHDLMVDGIIGGVGGVIVFLPSIMILFLFISLMEDTGYMARTAFLMDKAMHKMGLHGKSFIPMLMGFGCNVPAVMATRTIESKRDRILTMMAIPFMSCSARLPVYVLFISAFFPVFKGSILFSIYLIGIMAAFFTAVLLNKTVFKKAEIPFVMELPPYRLPTLKAVAKHMWFKTTFFLKKMGTIILVASIVVWALGYFPRDKKAESLYNQQVAQVETAYSQSIAQTVDKDEQTVLTIAKDEKISELELTYNAAHIEQSYISRIGQFISPVFEPLGFDWKMSVSILTGVLAKEIVVSSMGVLYHADSAADETSASLITKLQQSQKESQTPLFVYFGFLVFILMYFPCIGTLAAIRKETGNVSWMLFETLYTTALAWIVALAIYRIGMFFI
jgi:ferrous iron transport protein B